jgi:hypothetical protein
MLTKLFIELDFNHVLVKEKSNHTNYVILEVVITPYFIHEIDHYILKPFNLCTKKEKFNFDFFIIEMF